MSREVAVRTLNKIEALIEEEFDLSVSDYFKDELAEIVCRALNEDSRKGYEYGKKFTLDRLKAFIEAKELLDVEHSQD